MNLEVSKNIDHHCVQVGCRTMPPTVRGGVPTESLGSVVEELAATSLVGSELCVCLFMITIGVCVHIPLTEMFMSLLYIVPYLVLLTHRHITLHIRIL